MEGKISRTAEALWQGDGKKAKELGSEVEAVKDVFGENKSEAMRTINYLRLKNGERS